MKSVMAIIFKILFFMSLSAQTKNNSQVKVLNVAESFSNKSEISLSLFVDKISYVPLETKPEIVLGQPAQVEVTDDYIYVKNFGPGQTTQILLFDRNTGKFIREIGKPGRGPGEYKDISSLPFNPEKKEFYASGPLREILIYDINGNYTYKISIPQWRDAKSPDEFNSRIFCTTDNLIDGSTFVGYVCNFSGWEQRKIVLFTKDQIIKIFPNYQTFTRKDFRTIYSPPGSFYKFYKWDNKLYFIETFCDTLYQVTKDLLIPRYYFDYGKFKAPYSKQLEIISSQRTQDYFFLTDIDENKDYIFLQTYFNREKYLGFVEKNSNKITFCKKNTNGVSCLRDDIDGLMDVIPKEFTHKNEMVYLIQPAELFRWFAANPEKAVLAKNKLPWLNKIDVLSNPVIAIAKCKD
jgi:hypothetical protein